MWWMRFLFSEKITLGETPSNPDPPGRQKRWTWRLRQPYCHWLLLFDIRADAVRQMPGESIRMRERRSGVTERARMSDPATFRRLVRQSEQFRRISTFASQFLSNDEATLDPWLQPKYLFIKGCNPICFDIWPQNIKRPLPKNTINVLLSQRTYQCGK